MKVATPKATLVALTRRSERTSCSHFHQTTILYRSQFFMPKINHSRYMCAMKESGQQGADSSGRPISPPTNDVSSIKVTNYATTHPRHQDSSTNHTHIFAGSKPILSAEPYDYFITLYPMPRRDGDTRVTSTTMVTNIPYCTSPQTTESTGCRHRPLPYDPVRDAVAGTKMESTDMVLFEEHEVDGALQKPYQHHNAQLISEQLLVSWQPSH